MERCPVCRARFKEPVCRRCGADLSLPERVETRAAALERQTMALCVANDLVAAHAAIKEALTLEASPMRSALLGFVEQLLVMEQTRVVRRLMH